MTTLKKCFLGFSLVELLISLIIISVLAAVFAPVMTKKMTASKTALTMKTTTKCTDIDTECKLCATLSGTKKCLSCSRSCSGATYLDVASCTCKSCSAGCFNCSSATKCNVCQEGYGLSGGSCSQCASHTYSLGKTSCKNCPSGFYNNSTGQSSCSICEKTYYCQNGERKDCSDGYYSEAGAATCSKCPMNYYCKLGIKYPCPVNSQTNTEGAKTKDECICMDGFYYQSVVNRCIPCPKGMYCVNGNQKSCSNGKTTETVGASSSGECNTCPKGKLLESNSCVDCPIGYYCNNNQKTNCKLFGEYCTACTADGCTSCSRGFLENGYCTECDKFGEYCYKCNSRGCTDDGCSASNKNYYINGKYYCHLYFQFSWEGFEGKFVDNIVPYMAADAPCPPANNGRCCWQSGGPSGYVCSESAAIAICRNLDLRLATQSEILSLKALIDPANKYYNPALYLAVAKEGSFCSYASAGTLSYCPTVTGLVGGTAWPYDFFIQGGRYSVRGDNVGVLLYDSVGSLHSVRCVAQ